VTADMGVLRMEAGRPAVRFERLLPGTPEEVWSALTDPERIGRWLATVGSGRIEPAGSFELLMGDGPDGVVSCRVTAFRPPALLAFTWDYPGGPPSVVRIELRPGAAGTLLVFDHAGLAGPGAGYAAGWHAHLDALAGEVRGSAPELSWEERFENLLPAYRELASALS
jgi:uncharacterized protein YndB with AHSA1/START domain